MRERVTNRVKAVAVFGAYHASVVVCLAFSIVVPILLLYFYAHYLGPSARWFAYCAVPVALAKILWTYGRAGVFALRPRKSGMVVTPLMLPSLFAVVNQTIEQMRTAGYPAKNFEEIRLIGPPRVRTTDTGGQTTLYIGYSLLTSLPRQALQALIAHEISHHSNAAMSYYRAHMRCRESMHRFVGQTWRLIREAREQKKQSMVIGRFYRQLVVLFQLSLSLPVVLLQGCTYLLGWALKRQGQKFEYDCDRCAADVYSSEAFLSALRTAITIDHEWKYFIRSNSPTTGDVFASFAAFRESHVWTPSQLDRLWHIEGDEHPSYRNRAAALSRGGEASTAADVDDQPTVILPSHTAWLQTLNNDLVSRLKARRAEQRTMFELETLVNDLGLFDDMGSQDWSVIGLGVVFLLEHWRQDHQDHHQRWAQIIQPHPTDTWCEFGIAIIEVIEQRYSRKAMCANGLERIEHQLDAKIWRNQRHMWAQEGPGTAAQVLDTMESLIIQVTQTLDFVPPAHYRLNQIRRVWPAVGSLGASETDLDL